MKISLTEDQSLEALRGFLLMILPSGVEVIAGQDNMVAEPLVDDFVTMLPIMKHRINMNVTSFRDCAFVGSVAGTTLSVTDVLSGNIETGSQLFGPNVAENTIITELTGDDVYKVSVSQTVTSQELATGLRDDLSPKELTIQLDIHGPASTENTDMIETLFRSDYAADYFSRSAFDIMPLHCADGRQVVFNNAEQQSEKRWILDVVVQCNTVTTVPQEFADTLKVTTYQGDIL